MNLFYFYHPGQTSSLAMLMLADNEILLFIYMDQQHKGSLNKNTFCDRIERRMKDRSTFEKYVVQIRDILKRNLINR
jgi:hypothetical protein